MRKGQLVWLVDRVLVFKGEHGGYIYLEDLDGCSHTYNPIVKQQMVTDLVVIRAKRLAKYNTDVAQLKARLDNDLAKIR